MTLLSRPTISIGDALSTLVRGDLPVRFEAYDGSAAGPADADIRLELRSERGLRYLLTAPRDLGMARAYVAGDLALHGVHPGDPYAALALLQGSLRLRPPAPTEVVHLLRGLGVAPLVPPAPPPQEHLPRWRRTVEGLRHSMGRDAEAIQHHYDVSNVFYRHVLGPSMTYTCAVYPDETASLEQAQETKYDLVARKLDLRPGQRLLDIGCGWGGMVLHAAREHGVRALGVTLSQAQAEWAGERIREEGLEDLAEVRHLDYRLVEEDGFDAVSSIGLTEHIGVRNYPAYFGWIRDRLRPGGRLLNHCITRADNTGRATAGPFIDRYVFPDGELAGSGTIVTAVEDARLEVQHHENFRVHYARTLAAWCANLVEHWEECVAEVGEGTARVWGLYMAGSRLAFERNEIQLHHVLATRTDEHGVSGYPLRHTF
ncbi:cyclopropane-fatty-acyl-phospholipid synthase family protein [Nocardioides sp. zg-DK7169]|uniref:SAM-dependent methyltransferase n=1 Tax=Nocardioides sp. zg-DK7169 TaxID=2736600 RepID=UPI001556A954|nr:cyclopropane-fatty-acyl-phospholipid synthase family protein [Nocardioides sp. zg-DK7169]NPC98349.1 class I SAM-dependent methyltransferase [Nocardioides sp. zg-DK7169]